VVCGGKGGVRKSEENSLLGETGGSGPNLWNRAVGLTGRENSPQRGGLVWGGVGIPKCRKPFGTKNPSSPQGGWRERRIRTILVNTTHADHVKTNVGWQREGVPEQEGKGGQKKKDTKPQMLNLKKKIHEFTFLPQEDVHAEPETVPKNGKGQYAKQLP